MWDQLLSSKPMVEPALSQKLCFNNIINMASLYILIADALGDEGKRELKLCFALLRGVSEKTEWTEALACDIAKLMK